MAKKNKPVTEEFATVKVMTTNDYKMFKTLAGNRTVVKAHVRELINLMLTNGNMTDRFPIVIDNDGYVVDGQHRLAACQELGWEIGYIVEDKANIDTVRAINRGNRNWNWRDLAVSYAELGNDEYAWFLEFVDKYDLSFTGGLKLSGSKNTAAGNRVFSGGLFKTEDKPKAIESAERIGELMNIVHITSRDFLSSMYDLMQSPMYDHERMVMKLKQKGADLPEKANVSDYKRLVEEMYNYAYPNDSKVRLF